MTGFSVRLRNETRGLDQGARLQVPTPGEAMDILEQACEALHRRTGDRYSAELYCPRSGRVVGHCVRYGPRG